MKHNNKNADDSVSADIFFLSVSCLSLIMQNVMTAQILIRYDKEYYGALMIANELFQCLKRVNHCEIKKEQIEIKRII